MLRLDSWPAISNLLAFAHSLWYVYKDCDTKGRKAQESPCRNHSSLKTHTFSLSRTPREAPPYPTIHKMFKFLTIVALAFVLAITIAEGSDSKKDDPKLVQAVLMGFERQALADCLSCSSVLLNGMYSSASRKDLKTPCRA